MKFDHELSSDVEILNWLNVAVDQAEHRLRHRKPREDDGPHTSVWCATHFTLCNLVIKERDHFRAKVAEASAPWFTAEAFAPMGRVS